MELADVPRHRPFAFDKMESLIKEMQDPENGVPVRSQKLFLSVIPSAFTGYDLVEWLMERFNLEDTSNVEAINLGTQLCQYGYFFPVNDLKNLVLKDDSSLYRFQSPYYWPWQVPRVAGGSAAPTLGPDNVEYAIYLVKRTLRNKQRHGLEDYEQEALANLKKNLAAKWDFITMQAEEQVRLAKDRKKGDKIVSDSQERAYWRVARPPPGVPSALEHCPVPVRARHPRVVKKRTPQHVKKEIEHLKASLDRTRVKTSIALEALLAYSETFAPYDPWLTPPQPSNPWVSDDTLFWQINNPLVEVPSEKRVQRWALSIEELVSDPTGLQEFTSFLRKEYSHENIRFWTAVMDLRRSSSKQIPKKLEEIYEEFLKPGAPCEINIDGATAERVAEGLKSGSRYALDHAADHVYGLLLKKDCYPRFVRSDHFQRLLVEGRNVHQKKAKFFNFGGQVKKKPGGTSGVACGGGGAGLSRRRGSDRSLSGSAHELAHCAAQPARAADPPAHSHSQSNLAELADGTPWESAPRRRQDSAADSGSSSSDVSAAVERARRLPQQSTLDGGLRGAPPPLRRLSAVEPRHLAPLASPPHSPRPPPRPAPAPLAAVAPPHPTPTISVSSAPEDDSTQGSGSPEEPRSIAVSDEPSSVFASTAATPTEPRLEEEHEGASEPGGGSESRCTLRAGDEPAPDLHTLDETDSPSSGVPSRSGIDDLPIVSVEEEPFAAVLEPQPCSSSAPGPSFASGSGLPSRFSVPSGSSALSDPSAQSLASASSVPSGAILSTVQNGSSVGSGSSVATVSNAPSGYSVATVSSAPCESSVATVPSAPSGSSETTVPSAPSRSSVGSVSTAPCGSTVVSVSSAPCGSTVVSVSSAPCGSTVVSVSSAPCGSTVVSVSSAPSGSSVASVSSAPSGSSVASVSSAPSGSSVASVSSAPSGSSVASVSSVPSGSSVASGSSAPSVASGSSVRSVASEATYSTRAPVAPLAVGEDIGAEDDNADKVPSAAAPPPAPAPAPRHGPASDSDATKRIAHRDKHKDEVTSVSDSSIVLRGSVAAGERKQRNDICPWEDENSCESDAPFVKTYATLGYL